MEKNLSLLGKLLFYKIEMNIMLYIFIIPRRIISHNFKLQKNQNVH